MTDFQKNTSLIYACVWIYRAFRWKENNPDYFNYISRYLMAGKTYQLQTIPIGPVLHFEIVKAGDTTDLESYNFVDEVHRICQTMSADINKEDVIKIMGVKRTNANDLALIGLDSGVALYSTYPLMNSHCYCNTRHVTKKISNVYST